MKTKDDSLCTQSSKPQTTHDIQASKQLYIFNRLSGKFEEELKAKTSTLSQSTPGSNSKAIKPILKDFEDNSEVWMNPSTLRATSILLLSQIVTNVSAFYLKHNGLSFKNRAEAVPIVTLVAGFILFLMSLHSLRQQIRTKQSGDDKAILYFSKMRSAYNTQLQYFNLRVEMYYGEAEHLQAGGKGQEDNTRKEARYIYLEFSPLNYFEKRFLASGVHSKKSSGSNPRISFLTMDTSLADEESTSLGLQPKKYGIGGSGLVTGKRHSEGLAGRLIGGFLQKKLFNSDRTGGGGNGKLDTENESRSSIRGLRGKDSSQDSGLSGQPISTSSVVFSHQYRGRGNRNRLSVVCEEGGDLNRDSEGPIQGLTTDRALLTQPNDGGQTTSKKDNPNRRDDDLEGQFINHQADAESRRRREITEKRKAHMLKFYQRGNFEENSNQDSLEASSSLTSTRVKDVKLILNRQQFDSPSEIDSITHLRKIKENGQKKGLLVSSKSKEHRYSSTPRLAPLAGGIDYNEDDKENRDEVSIGCAESDQYTSLKKEDKENFRKEFSFRNSGGKVLTMFKLSNKKPNVKFSNIDINREEVTKTAELGVHRILNASCSQQSDIEMDSDYKISQPNFDDSALG